MIMNFTKYIFLAVVLVSIFAVSRADDSSEKPDGWWDSFKTRVKSVFKGWREDLKLLWNEVLSKADDMKGWTNELFESMRKKLTEILETRKDIPEQEKNDIENFITKLKSPVEDSKRKIDP